MAGEGEDAVPARECARRLNGGRAQASKGPGFPDRGDCGGRRPGFEGVSRENEGGLQNR
jgi:hypothetical protein